MQGVFVIWICCWLFFCTFCSWESLWGSSANSHDSNELLLIEQKIKILKERLHESNLQEMVEETEGQKFMLGDWEAYSKQLTDIRKQNEEEHKIELEIERLEKRKIELEKRVGK